MNIETVAWLVVSGAALGLGVRFFLAPNMRAHNAIILGIAVAFAGPWVVEKWGDSFSLPTIAALAVAAVAIAVGLKRARTSADRRRRDEFKRRANDAKS